MASTLAPLVEPPPAPLAPPTALETVPEGNNDQIVITKRGRVSKPKAMADTIYSKPVRRATIAPQTVASVEPKRSPRVTKAAAAAAAQPVAPVAPTSPQKNAPVVVLRELATSPPTDVKTKTWFKYPRITSEDVEVSVLKLSHGMPVCALCKSSHFRSKATAIEHFHTIHGDYAVAVLDKYV